MLRHPLQPTLLIQFATNWHLAGIFLRHLCGAIELHKYLVSCTCIFWMAAFSILLRSNSRYKEAYVPIGHKGSGIAKYTDLPSFPRRRESTTAVDPRLRGDDDGIFLSAASLNALKDEKIHSPEYSEITDQVLINEIPTRSGAKS